MAADQGSSIGQFNLGCVYRDGNGVTKNPAEAAKWFGRAADQGHAKAQYSLGLLYCIGDGTPVDLAAAERLFASASKQGHEGSKNMLESIRSNR